MFSTNTTNRVRTSVSQVLLRYVPLTMYINKDIVEQVSFYYFLFYFKSGKARIYRIHNINVNSS